METLIKLIAWFYSRAPRKLTDFLGRALGYFLYLILPPKRKLARDALRASFPEWPDDRIKAVSRGVFLTQGRFLTEILQMIGNARANPIDLIDCDPGLIAKMDELQAKETGVLILTAHLNNYEALLNWAARRYKMAVVTKRVKPKALDDLFVQMRLANKINILPARGSYRRILKALKEGSGVGFVIDQSMKPKDGIHVTFFGRPANTTPGLAMLSAHAKAPVLPVCLMKQGERYQLKAYPLMQPPPDHAPETLQDATQQYSNVIEAMIREQPEAWIWMHRRWKYPPNSGDRVTLPDGSERFA